MLRVCDSDLERGRDKRVADPLWLRPAVTTVAVVCVLATECDLERRPDLLDIIDPAARWRLRER